MVKEIPADWVVFPLHGTDGDLCTCGNRRCKSPGKHPYAGIKDFLKTALPRDEAIEKWPDHKWNWGVIPGQSGFVGFDIDVKDGKQGRESFAMLQKQYGKLPETTVIETPSGGFHALFQRPDVPLIPNSNGSITDGIDVRGDSGYLVAPGSIVFGKTYTVFKDDPIAPLPVAWLPLVLSKEPEPVVKQISTIGSYSVPDVAAYQSQSEADFALAGRMKAAGNSFQQFANEVGNLRSHDRKSGNQKYLQTTWNNASIIDQDDGEIDLIGFESVPAGQYIWHCTEWTTICPFGRKAFRFDGSIIGSE